jgi:Outer membrane protein beta-barrel domain
MKIKTLICVCVLLTQSAFAQFKSSLELISGADMTYRTAQTSVDSLQFVIKSRNTNEKPRMNWRFGLNYHVQITERFGLKTGLRYATAGYLLSKQNDLRWPSQHNQNGGYDPNLPGEGKDVSLWFRYSFIEIPVAVRYQLNAPSATRRFSSYLEGGIAPNLYRSTKFVSKLDDQKSSNTISESSVQKLHWVAQISYGLTYQFKNADALFFQPIARFHLNKTKNAAVQEHLYSFGVELGYRKSIN